MKSSTRSREQETDGALVARCLAGDGTGWNTLVQRHGPLVWAIARRAGLSEADAADVFQNTWTLALEQLSQLRNAALFERWISTVARNQALRVRRGYGIARSALPRVAREDVDHAEPSEPIEQLERRSAVHAALEQLGERCSQLLKTLYFETNTPSYSEVAARLNMRIGSIGPTRARCFERLRGLLEGGSDV